MRRRSASIAARSAAHVSATATGMPVDAVGCRTRGDRGMGTAAGAMIVGGCCPSSDTSELGVSSSAGETTGVAGADHGEASGGAGLVCSTVSALLISAPLH
ncbi:hypothetical protein AMAG_18920 [Allomyces macrogynus ATCC 38327]|uniref:Uncharacterized protein n=1 Tax=Allomyces macrogynus (strain ATCC 38327) TaxID=578462 RepID=A0A0L0SK10_ALLM3|nr:hypothetical protein AMAG_18920 [Allomyces macrogynus ATCC 38327]|eukprot:KNE62813.1 hypothetical protein AMAG_18920 [Allomyces macrogynus ATCC 38327]